MTPNRINSKLQSLRSLLRRLIALAGLARVILVTVGVGALCLVADWTFRLSGSWRVTLAFAGLAGIAAALWSFLIRPLLVSLPDDQLALLYEREFPELSDALVSAVQLARVPGSASEDMVAAVITHAESASEGISPVRVPRNAKVSRHALCAFLAAAVAVGFCIMAPGSAHTFAARYLDPFGPAEWPRNTGLSIEVAGSRASEVSVAKGEQVAVKVRAVNARRSAHWTAPAKVWLDYGNASVEKNSRPMRRTEADTYEAYFNDLPEDLVVRARAGGAETETVQIKVVELPHVEDIWLSFEYPKYTGREPYQPSRSTSELRGIVGTKVRVQIKANCPLATDGAALRIDPAGVVPMQRAAGNGGSRYEGEFVLATGMKWFRVQLVDANGIRNRNPRTFQLTVVDDKVPLVKLVKPGGPTRCTPHAVLPLEATVKDDLRVRSARLRFALGSKEEPKLLPLELPPGDPKSVRIAKRWDLAELRLKVGQTVSYRVEADDFRDVFPAGSKQTRQVGRSDEHFIRIVSSADLASELDRRLFALRDEVKKAKTNQEADRRKITELLRKMSEGKPMTNDDRGLAADAENVQRELGRHVDRIAAEIGKVRRRMQDNRIGSFASRRRLDDVQATLEDIARGDMPRAAQFIKDARKDLGSRDGRNNLQTTSGIQKSVIKRLEKVLAAMAHNEDIDNLVRAARELLRKERGIKANTGEFARRPGTFGAAPNQLKPADFTALNLLVRRQRGARDDMSNLEQQMLNVYQRLKERDATRADLVRKAQVGASRDQIRLMMEEGAAKLLANRIGLAGARQDVAIKGLETLLARLQEAREESGNSDAMSQVYKDVERALEEVQRLRKLQEGHRDDAAEINKDAGQAKRLKQLRREIQRLRELQNKTRSEAQEKSRLKELAATEASHAEKATGIKGKLDKEAEAAAKRDAQQQADIKKSAGAMSDAQAKMKAATGEMKASDQEKTQKSTADAARKLAEAKKHLDDALKKLEEKRLANTKEAAIKQGETAKQTAEAAAKIGQLAKESEGASREAAAGLKKAGGKVGEAGKSMGKSHTSMDKNDSVQGEQEAEDALKKLRDAEEVLKKIRDDLRKKQKEQKLLDLIVELQPMLEKQIEINDETLRIDAASVSADDGQPSRPDKVRLGQLSGDESSLRTKASEVLKKVEGENAPVFVWACQKIVKDMGEASERLGRFETGSYTQDLGKDISDTLRMLIESLKREQSKMEKGGGGGGGGGGGKKKPMLVPPAAQLKLLKIRELVIHNRTKRLELKRLLKSSRKLTPLQKKRVRKLAEEQAQLGNLTNGLAEALERQAREGQGNQEKAQ